MSFTDYLRPDYSRLAHVCGIILSYRIENLIHRKKEVICYYSLVMDLKAVSYTFNTLQSELLNQSVTIIWYLKYGLLLNTFLILS